MRAAAKIAVFVVGLMLGSTANLYAADPPAVNFVSLKLEGSCGDAKNSRLWLANTHTFKTIVVVVKWKASGGKDLQDSFYPGPNSVREIGCAAEGEILEAKFAEF